MSPEHVQEEVAAEDGLGLADGFALTGAESLEVRHQNVIALKFGGSSLLGAERMLHAAGLVHTALQASNVVVVVSAMKGVTDRLLSVSRALAEGDFSHARNEAEGVVHLHFNVLHDLQLGEEQEEHVRRVLQLLSRDLLHEVPEQGRVAATAELADRLASFGERLSARLFAAALEFRRLRRSRQLFRLRPYLRHFPRRQASSGRN